MLKGKSSYQIEALSQASESSHTMIISRPGRDVVTRRPTRWAAPGYDPIEQRPASSGVLVPPCPTSSRNRGRHDRSGPLMALQVPPNHVLIGPETASATAEPGSPLVIVSKEQIVGRAWARYYPLWERCLL